MEQLFGKAISGGGLSRRSVSVCFYRGRCWRPCSPRDLTRQLSRGLIRSDVEVEEAECANGILPKYKPIEAELYRQHNRSCALTEECQSIIYYTNRYVLRIISYLRICGMRPFAKASHLNAILRLAQRRRRRLCAHNGAAATQIGDKRQQVSRSVTLRNSQGKQTTSSAPKKP